MENVKRGVGDGGSREGIKELHRCGSLCVEMVDRLLFWLTSDDSDPEGGVDSAVSFQMCLWKLAVAADKGWALLDRYFRVLTETAMDVVTVCGVSGHNAHEAALKLADRTACTALRPFGYMGTVDLRRSMCVSQEFMKWLFPATFSDSDPGEEEFARELREWQDLFAKRRDRAIKKLAFVDQRELEVFAMKLTREYVLVTGSDKAIDDVNSRVPECLAEVVLEKKGSAEAEVKPATDEAEKLGEQNRSPRPYRTRDEKAVVILAALTDHHKYEDQGGSASIGNWSSITGRSLAEQAKVNRRDVTEFMQKHFGGQKEYECQCHNRKLPQTLQKLRGEEPGRGLIDDFSGFSDEYEDED